jgi:HK97 family phage portal protein
VPVINRAINLVSSNVASLPRYWYKDNRKLEKVPKSLMQFDSDFYNIVNHIIQSLWIFGASYLLPTASRVGSNATLDALSTNNITLVHNSDGAISHFIFSFYAITEKLYPDECVYIWLNNPINTNYPGVSPLKASYLSGFSLYNLDAFTQRFFKNGAVRASLLKIGSEDPLKPMPSREEVSRLQRLWDNLLSGTKNAFRSLVLSNDVKVEQIGDGLKEIDYNGITESRTRDVLAGLGVPKTLIFGEDANYASMHQAYISFYTNTLLPVAELVNRELNDQYLKPTFGYTFKFHPDELEVFQTSEFEKAQKVLLLKEYLTYNEVREAFGYAPIENSEPDTNVNENEERDNDEDDEPETKSYKLTLSDTEKNLYNRLLEVFSPYLDTATNSILANADFNYDNLSEDLQTFFVSYFSDFFIDESNNIINQTGVPIPIEDLMTASGEFAETYTFELVKGIVDTTRTMLQSVMSSYMNTPGMTRKDVENKLQNTFGSNRASAIAVTETTRASAKVVEHSQEYYRDKLGLNYIRKWNTNADDLTCPICAPLDGKYENEIPNQEIPAHVNCRCFWTLELQKDDNDNTT